MIRSLCYVLAGAVWLACSQLGLAHQEPDAVAPDLKKSATAFVERLTKEQFADAAKDFDSALQKTWSAEKLQEMWKAMTKQVGPFKKQVGIRMEKSPTKHFLLVTCQFEKMTIDIRLAFNNAKQITDLALLPAASGVEYKPPDYVRLDSFRETEVTIGKGEWELPGTLTLPTGQGPFPAVVLVHGSGPNDRDETILVNKPFRDLAWGLASRGIGVLRYDKRTRVHGGKIVALKETFTVKEEVIDDALAAVALLRSRKEIDEHRIFVLGHSLGALLAPKIATLDSGIAGLIIMAGPTRPLEDLILEQVTYIFSLEGGPTESQRAELDKIKDQVARVKDAKLSRDTPAAELPLGSPAAYWLSLRGYHPAEVAAKLPQRLLILQGERDYQVTMEDFRGWENALHQRARAELKSYPKMNHLFIEGEGEGKAKPSDYQKPGHVGKAVVDDIARWIKKAS